MISLNYRFLGLKPLVFLLLTLLRVAVSCVLKRRKGYSALSEEEVEPLLPGEVIENQENNNRRHVKPTTPNRGFVIILSILSFILSSIPLSPLYVETKTLTEVGFFASSFVHLVTIFALVLAKDFGQWKRKVVGGLQWYRFDFY